MEHERSARVEWRFTVGSLLLLLWATAGTLIVFGYEYRLQQRYARLGWYGPYVADPPPSVGLDVVYGPERVARVNEQVETWGNVVLFAPAVLALAIAFPHLRARTLFLATVAASIASELAQLLSDGRTAELRDVAANATGAAVMTVLVAAGRRLRRRRRSDRLDLDAPTGPQASEHQGRQPAGHDGQHGVDDHEANSVTPEGDQREADRPVGQRPGGQHADRPV